MATPPSGSLTWSDNLTVDNPTQPSKRGKTVRRRSREEWEPFKNLIRERYYHQKKTLLEVQEDLREMDFDASQSQLKHKLREWSEEDGQHKNTKPRDPVARAARPARLRRSCEMQKKGQQPSEHRMERSQSDPTNQPICQARKCQISSYQPSYSGALAKIRRDIAGLGTLESCTEAELEGHYSNILGSLEIDDEDEQDAPLAIADEGYTEDLPAPVFTDPFSVPPSIQPTGHLDHGAYHGAGVPAGGVGGVGAHGFEFNVEDFDWSEYVQASYDAARAMGDVPHEP